MPDAVKAAHGRTKPVVCSPVARAVTFCQPSMRYASRSMPGRAATLARYALIIPMKVVPVYDGFSGMIFELRHHVMAPCGPESVLTTNTDCCLAPLCCSMSNTCALSGRIVSS